MFTIMLRTLLLAPLACLALGSTSPAQEAINYEQHANGFALDHGLTGLTSIEVNFRQVIDGAYAHVTIGMFEVYHPIPDLDNSGVARTFQGVCRQLITMQQTWLDNLQPESGRLKDVEADLKTMDKWVKSWSLGRLADLDLESPHDLLDAFKAKDKYRAASLRLTDSFLRGESLGLERPLDQFETSPLILCPTRREFVRLVCYAGLLYETERSKYWADNLHEWIEGRIMNMRALALEYVDVSLQVGDIYGGQAMNVRHTDELEQHVIQRAFLSMMQSYFGNQFDPALAVGFAINFNVDVFGLDHGRLEGDPRGNSTPPREVFIPGGNPDGGYLPPLSAESPYRELEGEFRYVGKLSATQVAGNTADQNQQARLQSFLIHADTGSGKHVVMSPFLGTSALKAPVPPTEFLGDYQEFFRAYRTVFMHWLRTEAGSSKKDSAKKFAQLLCALGASTGEGDPNLEALIPTIYDGLVLSNVEQNKDCLEGRFLRWLKLE
ncbi:MAG: hypothetical protein ACJAZ8_000424 [Planctomycetota bacterium]|jgi:hypothetical protein